MCSANELCCNRIGTILGSSFNGWVCQLIMGGTLDWWHRQSILAPAFVADNYCCGSAPKYNGYCLNSPCHLSSVVIMYANLVALVIFSSIMANRTLSITKFVLTEQVS